MKAEPWTTSIGLTQLKRTNRTPEQGLYKPKVLLQLRGPLLFSNHGTTQPRTIAIGQIIGLGTPLNLRSHMPVVRSWLGARKLFQH